MGKVTIIEAGQTKSEPADPEEIPRVITVINLSKMVCHSITNIAAQAVEYLVKQQNDYAKCKGFMHSELNQQVIGLKGFFENGMIFLPIPSRGNEDVVSGCIRKFRILSEGKDIA